VSKLLGSVKNDATTFWAHDETGITPCPMPGMLTHLIHGIAGIG